VEGRPIKASRTCSYWRVYWLHSGSALKKCHYFDQKFTTLSDEWKNCQFTDEKYRHLIGGDFIVPLFFTRHPRTIAATSRLYVLDKRSGDTL
jgi:hypothetical protein